jgi:hypothetical protein
MGWAVFEDDLGDDSYSGVGSGQGVQRGFMGGVE